MSLHTSEDSLLPCSQHKIELISEISNECYFDIAGAGGWMAVVKHALSVIKPERLPSEATIPMKLAARQTTKLTSPEELPSSS